MIFELLYKRTSTGAIERWQIIVEENFFYTIHGQVDGVKTTTEPTFCEGKNLGKKNETTPEEQAIAEAESKHKKKLKAGYKLDIKDVDEFTFYKPMLAYNFNDYDINYPVLSQPKLDGMRCVVQITRNGMYSRTGEKVNSCPFILSALQPLFKDNPNLILDGELYSHKLKHNFNKLMSLLRKKDPTPAEIEECRKYVKYHVYDAPCINSLTEKDPFHTRFLAVQDLLNNIEYIEIVETTIVHNKEELDALYEKYLAEGYEGQIVRLNGPYENKRSVFLLKRKEFVTEEFEIVDILEGKGNRNNIAGSVSLLKDGRVFEAGIVGNFRFAETLYLDRAKNIGKMGTVKYFHLTPDGIPRFGHLIEIRDYE